MNIPIIYATNSGSTGLVARQLKSILEQNGHKADLVNAKDTAQSTFFAKEFVIIGTNSWLYEFKEGQPHKDILAMLDRIKGTDLSGIKFAFFGCGDKSYINFCNGVDILEQAININNGLSIIKTLKIDSYYYDLENNTKQVEEWANNLVNILSQI